MRSLSNFSNFLASSSALDLYLKPQPLPASFQSIPTHGDMVKRNRAYSAAAKWAPFRARRGSGSRRWRQLERPSRLWVALTYTNWVGLHIDDGECIYNETYYQVLRPWVERAGLHPKSRGQLLQPGHQWVRNYR